MTGLALHLAALFCVAWLATSLLASAVIRAFEARVAPLEPRARLRLMFAALIAPLGVGTIIVLGVAVPHQWIGLADHCLDHPGHLHVCLLHGAPIPHPLVFGLLVVACAWSVHRLVTSGANAWRSVRALRRVVDAARVQGELRVVPGRAPLAFTAGLLSPCVVVSEAVAVDLERWGAVLEHERAHAKGRDPLVRWIAEALTAFHLPVLGADLVVRLRGAQELVADEMAARAIGCRVEVAEALIEWMRWSHSSPVPGLGFDSGPFALRVHRLLDPEAVRSGPSARHLMILALGFLALISATAFPLHHAVETFFGFLLS